MNKAIRVIGAVKPPKRHSVDEVLAQYAKDTGSGKELNQDQFEDVMKILSKDVAGRVTVTCGIMVGCPMLGGILVNMALAKFGRPSAARPCGSLLFRLLEPQFPTIVSLVLMLVLLPLLLDALDSYLENRQSKLGAMKELVRADSTPQATTRVPASDTRASRRWRGGRTTPLTARPPQDRVVRAQGGREDRRDGRRGGQARRGGRAQEEEGLLAVQGLRQEEGGLGAGLEGVELSPQTTQ